MTATFGSSPSTVSGSVEVAGASAAAQVPDEVQTRLEVAVPVAPSAVDVGDGHALDVFDLVGLQERRDLGVELEVLLAALTHERRPLLGVGEPEQLLLGDRPFAHERRGRVLSGQRALGA